MAGRPDRVPRHPAGQAHDEETIHIPKRKVPTRPKEACVDPPALHSYPLGPSDLLTSVAPVLDLQNNAKSIEALTLRD